MNARSFRALVCTICLASFAEHACSATVGYWQFQDAVPTNPVVTVASTVNNGVLQGSTTLGAPTFNASVPGTNFGGIFTVIDGLGGPTVNANNTGSVAIANNDRIQIPRSALTESASMTIEFFMKTTQSGAFAGVAVLPSTVLSGSGGNIAWGLGTQSGNTAFYRVDVTGVSGVNKTGQGGTVVNDNQWHHLALTFDGPGNGVRLYRDYQLVSIAGLPGGLTYDGVNGIRFGTSSTDFQNYIGLLDEVRYSDVLLTPDQFLRAVPEPASGILMAIGALVLHRFRRRK